MSKVDAQRAMREARYAARNSGSAPTRREAAPAAGAPSTPAVRTPRAEPAPAVTAPPTSAAPEGARCGHQSMNGRSCTREAGHPQKSHRYS